MSATKGLHIEVAAAELELACSRAAGVVEKKATMPILSSVLLEGQTAPDGGRMVVSAYDMEIGVRSTHPCKVISAGSICLNADRLFAIARAASESVITIRQAERGRVIIESGRSTAKLATESIDDFPALPVAPKDGFFQVSDATLGSLIDQTEYAIGTEAAPYNIQGLRLEAKDGNLCATGFNGQRMGFASLPAEGLPATGLQVTIPAKGIRALRRILKETTAQPGEMSIGTERVDYRRGGLFVTLRLIAADFPDCSTEKIGSDWSMTIGRSRLLESLGRLDILPNENLCIVVAAADGALTITSDGNRGSMTEEIAVESQAKFQFGVNARYFRDTLSAITHEQVVLEGVDELHPIILRTPINRDPIHVVGVMRIS